MKKMILSAVASLLLFGSISCAQSSMINSVSQLPKNAQTFIANYFGNEKISYMKMENELLESTYYEVKFVSGADVEFDKNGEWVEVDCKKNALPAGFIPASIANYVKTQFPNNTITQIEKDFRGYSVELNNDLDLEFNTKGEFKRIDD